MHVSSFGCAGSSDPNHENCIFINAQDSFDNLIGQNIITWGCINRWKRHSLSKSEQCCLPSVHDADLLQIVTGHTDTSVYFESVLYVPICIWLYSTKISTGIYKMGIKVWSLVFTVEQWPVLCMATGDKAHCLWLVPLSFVTMPKTGNYPAVIVCPEEGRKTD